MGIFPDFTSDSNVQASLRREPYAQVQRICQVHGYRGGKSNIFIEGGREKEIKLHNNTYASPFVLKLKQNCIYSYMRTQHTPLYMWMHRNPSKNGNINCKVTKIFSQMLGTWKMLNKWWLLFPCASKFFGAYRNSFMWIMNSHKWIIQMSVFYWNEHICKPSQ